MSEFEKHMNSEYRRDEQDSPSLTEQPIPADFSEEDLAFALELNTLFSPEDETLPPYYVQTLLESEDPRFTPVDTHFVERTNAQVFRSLKLKRRLFPRKRAALLALAASLRNLTRRKTVLAWVAVLMLFMIFTVAYTAPSFAQGLTLLLHGARSGVFLVHHYPAASSVKHNQQPAAPINDASDPAQMSLALTQSRLHFNIYWPQSIPDNYVLTTINVYQDPGNTWADGPMIELIYDLSIPDSQIKGTGEIVIREFKPTQQVLQLVQDGAASAIDPDQYGNARAIYVDGQWQRRGKLQPIWISGGRSEVIYQQNGVVFWIAGDQRDGIGEKTLWNMAQSMQPLSFTRPSLVKGEMATLLQNDNLPGSPFSNDVLVIFPDNSNSSPYFISVSSYLSGKSPTKVTRAGH